MNDYTKWLEYAKEKDSKLRCNEFIHICTVKHIEGSLLYFSFALVEEYEKYTIVFTEHFGYFVFDNEDVKVMWKER